MTTPINLLEVALAEIDSVMADLEAAIPRMTLTATYGERTSSGSKTAPAPVNIDAVSAKHALHTWLIKTALLVGEPFGRRDIPALASHLLTHMPTIVANGWAQTLHNELQPLLNDCRDITRERGHTRHLGPCTTIGCETPLTAAETDTETRCPTCGHTYHIHEHQQHRTLQALGHDGTPLRAAEAVRTLRKHGIPVTTKDIENWVTWGHLTETSRDHKNRRLYNLKHIYTLAARKA